MGGGLLQLVAYGAQDVYLTGNPQITFWKTVYRRHTNFAIDTVDVPFTGSVQFGTRASLTIPRKGDLLSKMYLRVELPSGTASSQGAQWAWVRRVGHSIIRNIQFSIGGQIIDKQTSTWLNIWYDLTHPLAKDTSYLKMIGDTPALTTMAQSHNSSVLHIPLQFYSCRQIGTPILLIALQYHEVKLDIDFESLQNLVITSGFQNEVHTELGISHDFVADLVCEMVLLDTDERRRFAQNSHEQLVEQLQQTGISRLTVGTTRIALTYNHPVKELTWITRLGKFVNPDGRFKFLAYHPTDMDAMRLQATKRFVLTLARYTGGNRLVLNNNVISAQLNLPNNLLTMFNEIQAVAITTEPVVGNVTILGRMLTIEEISRTVDDLFQGVTRSTVGDGMPIHDVVLKQYNNYGLTIDGAGNMLSIVTLQFNGQERISRDGAYFNMVQPWQAHTRSPPDGLYVYSFALSPEDSQPSGTCNFSRIDTAVLAFEITETTDYTNAQLLDFMGDNTYVDIFATNYNVLRVMSGMAGLSYSN